MTSLTPRQPRRPLIWPDAVLDLADLLSLTDDEVFIVGGAVRDAYLHRPLKDLDLITPRDAIRLARRLANYFHGDFFVMDAERDVARALVTTPQGRLNIDVARLRADTLYDDLLDRDFTINAMAVDLRDGLDLLIDPLEGETDLNNRLIRRCAPDALANDPIRALRAVRQSVQLGCRITPETLADIRAQAGRLYAEVSPERVRDEFFKLLGGTKPVAALRVADALGLLSEIVPVVSARKAADAWQTTLLRVEKLERLLMAISPARTDETAANFELGIAVMGLDRFRSSLQAHLAATWPNDRPHTALLLLAALLLPVTAGETVALAPLVEALRLSNAEEKRLAPLLRTDSAVEHVLALTEITPLIAHRFWRPLGEAGVDACLLALASYNADAGLTAPTGERQDNWIALIERARALLDAYYLHHDTVVQPPPLVDGSLLQRELGLKPGPRIGHLLDQVREAQVTGAVSSTEEALALARELLKSQP